MLYLILSLLVVAVLSPFVVAIKRLLKDINDTNAAYSRDVYTEALIAYHVQRATSDAWESPLWGRICMVRSHVEEIEHTSYCALHTNHFGLCASAAALVTSDFN